MTGAYLSTDTAICLFFFYIFNVHSHKRNSSVQRIRTIIMVTSTASSTSEVRVLRNYINGEFVSGGEGFIASIAPATGQHIADAPRSGKAEIDQGMFSHCPASTFTRVI